MIKGSSIVVSIIVPIYNVEKYLEKCIISILNQSYENYEIILVNDGSTDGSEKICEKYGSNPKVKYYKKTNGGLSDARNYGLLKASGSHVMFVDSDDYLHPECLMALVQLINEDVQVSCVGQCNVRVDENIIIKRNLDEQAKGIITGPEALEYLCLRKHFGTSAWGKLYDINLFKDIRFPVGIIHEDIWTVPYIMDCAKKVAYEDSSLYYYVQHSDSIMHKRITEATYTGFEGLNKLVHYIDCKYPNMHDAAICRWISDFFGTIMNRLVYEDDYYETSRLLRHKYKNHFREVFRNKYVSKIKKVQSFLFLNSLPGLRFLMKLYIGKKRNY